MAKRLQALVINQRIVLILVVVVFAIWLRAPAVAGKGNVEDVLRQASITGIIAVAMTMVIITGGLDLSVGSVLALSGVLLVTFQQFGMVVAFAVAIGAGCLVGLINGLLVARAQINALIVTLGTMTAVQGVALLVAKGYPINGPGGSFEKLGNGSIGPVPCPLVLFAAAIFAAQLFLRYTRVGRNVFAVGGNLEASRLSGIDTKLVTTLTYVFSGLCAGIAGTVLASRLNTGSPVVGTDTALDVITAVVLGGTSLSGGQGSVIKTLLGVLVMSVLANGLNLMHVYVYYQWLTRGVILIGVVVLDSYFARRRTGVARVRRPIGSSSAQVGVEQST